MQPDAVMRKLHWAIMAKFCLLTLLNHMDRANLVRKYSAAPGPSRRLVAGNWLKRLLRDILGTLRCAALLTEE